MFARITLAAAAFSLAAALSAPAEAKPAKPEEWAAACGDWDEWAKPAPPVHVFANVYQVGTCGISAILITGSVPEGMNYGGKEKHILIDGGPAEAADLVLANIEQAGFDPEGIHVILYSHEHLDHVGALAKIRQDAKAALYAHPRALTVMQTGETAKDDPQYGAIDNFPGARVSAPLRDGQTIGVADNVIRVLFTPGHTKGAMSYTWRACDYEDCKTIVYADSLSAVSAEGYRFTDHPEVVADLRRSIALVGSLECDILLTPHPSASEMRDRFAGTRPLVDPTACKAYADAALAKLEARIAKEQGGQ
ncbi:subclass B3 metallo-beta-lactamase [Sphingomicrobium nitratireducens]|uniref:subclass B3 metallo-beta-lactamase n=1 Tax=Sphingomicrobium nitratireducens TaxID=2964666 RepID=UPI00223F8DA9|nr:subclass B3 metallo-beta-lactamase [Sphingomicrobium nitratireducens]